MGKGTTTTTEQRIDPGAERFRNQAFADARNISNLGYTPFANPALSGLTSNLGFGTNVLQGLTQGISAQDISRFSDPFEASVVSAIQGDYDRMRAMGLNDVGAQATAAGAFGGSRHGIAEGTMLGELGRSEAGTLAGLRSGNFQNSIQNLLAERGQMGAFGGTLANLGLSGLNTQYSEFLRQQNMPYQQMAVQQGLLGVAPVSTTQTQHQSGSLMRDLMGLGVMGAGLLTGGAAPAAMGAMGAMTPQVNPISTGPQQSFLPQNYQRQQMPPPPSYSGAWGY